MSNDKDITLAIEKNKAVNCEICGKSFSRQANLILHMASIHDEKRPFKCDICDYKL